MQQTLITLATHAIVLAVGLALGYLIERAPRASATLPEAPHQVTEDVVVDLAPAAIPVAAPAAAPVPAPRREATGAHVVLYFDGMIDGAEAVTLYDGPSEAAARDAWETISLQHPAPAGHMEWWRPDGSLRGAWPEPHQ